MIGLRRKIPAVVVPDDCTHVLAWMAPYLLVGWDGEGYWDLQTRANYDAGTFADGRPPLRRKARNSDPAGLAAWVSGELGHPVTLTADMQDIKLHRHGRWHSEPIYYVSARARS